MIKTEAQGIAKAAAELYRIEREAEKRDEIEITRNRMRTQIHLILIIISSIGAVAMTFTSGPMIFHIAPLAPGLVSSIQEGIDRLMGLF